MDKDTEFHDDRIEALRKAGIPDDQITLALTTAETLLNTMQEIAATYDDSDETMRQAIIALAGEPRV